MYYYYKRLFLAFLCLSLFTVNSLTYAQENFKSGNIPSQGAYRLQKPNYQAPYGQTKPTDVKATLDQVFNYLNKVTPYQSAENVKNPNTNNDKYFKQGDYSVIHYTWGVTYSGMLDVFEKTKDTKYKDYTLNRINFIAETAEKFTDSGSEKNIASHILHPKSLDEVGALTTAMMQAKKAGFTVPFLDKIIDQNIGFLKTEQYYMPDGTLARNKTNLIKILYGWMIITWVCRCYCKPAG